MAQYLDLLHSEKRYPVVNLDLNNLKTNVPDSDIPSLIADNITINFCIFIKSNLGPIPQSHPFRIKKELSAKVPHHAHIVDCFFTKNGILIVKTTHRECATELLQITEFCNIAVTPSLQRDSTTSKFLLHDIPNEVPLFDLVTEIADNNLICSELRRFTKKSPQGELTPSTTILVTIFGTQVPDHIKIWFQIKRLQLFIDRPRQCTSCWKFSHNARICSEQLKCEKCGSNHSATICQETTLKCANCEMNHKASDRNCPKYLEESKFLTFKCSNHLSFPEARRMFNSANKASPSYASKVSESSANTVTMSAVVQMLETQWAQTQEMIHTLIAAQTQSLLELQEKLRIEITKDLKSYVKDLDPKKRKTSQAKEARIDKRRGIVDHDNQDPSMSVDPFSPTNPIDINRSTEVDWGGQ